jgi:hypothetical protein
MMEKVEDHLDVDMNFTNAQDHVPDAERKNETIKERIRASYHRLPYKAIPRIMIQYSAMIVGGKRKPEENVTDSETNENPRKRTFSRDTTKEG